MKAAIFDFDGTIFDSASYWEEVLQDTLTRHGLPPARDLFSQVKPFGVTLGSQWLVREFGLPADPKVLAAGWRERMQANYQSVIPLKANAESYMRSLKGDDVILCLATAMEADFVEKALEREGIADLFDLVVTTGQIGCDKTGPDIFLYCADYFSLAPEDCMVYEDSLDAAVCCKDAGFQVTGVFDGISIREYEEMEKICDQAFQDF